MCARGIKYELPGEQQIALVGSQKEELLLIREILDLTEKGALIDKRNRLYKRH